MFTWAFILAQIRVTGLCEGNLLVAGEFPAQMASNAENVSIWWRHHGLRVRVCSGQVFVAIFIGVCDVYSAVNKWWLFAIFDNI